MTSKSALPISLLVFAVSAPLALAKVTEKEAARLGKDLTPLGAEVAGEGDVPAWTGGLTGVPDGIKFDPKTQHPPNPYPDDKVKYTITRQNMAEYDALLTDGHKAMLKRWPKTFKVNVYESRRSCAVPMFVHEATKENARKAKLSRDGESIQSQWAGTPFPFPKNGRELMWNHKLRYLPEKLTRSFSNVMVRSDGKYGVITLTDQTWRFWNAPSETRQWVSSNNVSNVFLRQRQDLTNPPALAGMTFVVHASVDAAATPYMAWHYSPATRRVRRAPDMTYDGPAFGSNGAMTADAVNGFGGPLDRYDWSIQGRHVKLVPYNAYLVANSKYSDLIRRQHLNPGLLRYEPHRVWTVEAVLRAGQTHLYERRVLHVDEDTWAVVAGELYDGRGQLSRVQEVHTANFYQVPGCLPVAELVYRMQARSGYFAGSLVGEETPLVLALDDGELLPESVRVLTPR